MQEKCSTCPKCGRMFKLKKTLCRHLKRKIPCDRKLECVKCNKIFSDKGTLNRHLRRKTPCEPILGNTQEPIRNSRTCHFCYREFTLKKNLKRHFQTCKIRNGNMPILFRKIEEDRKIIEDLKKENSQIKNIICNIQNNTSIQNNINLQFNVGSFFENSLEKKLLNFGDIKSEQLVQNIIEDEEDRIRQVIQRPPEGKHREVGQRIIELVQLIYRNPQYPQLQNVFTQNSQEHFKNWKDPKPICTFLWYRNQWTQAEWDKVKKYIIKQINQFMPSHRKDKLQVKSNLRKACESLDKEIKEKISPPTLINSFFGDYEDSRTDTDFVWIFLAQALDQKGLLNMREILGMLRVN